MPNQTHSYIPLPQLYLIRHCQASGQAPEAPLTARGYQQAEALSDLLSSFPIEYILSSPYRRARETALPLAHARQLELATDERLVERTLSATPREDWLDCLRQTFDDPDLCFEGGESSRAATTRAIAALRDLQQRQHMTSALVTHGNLAALLLKHFDPSINFASWQAMRTPDIYRLTFSEDSLATIEHIEHTV
ncbi:histidine phosphatase family protein [Ktedonospora formicarum]|uniref:Phosphoglycerate mutase n=1 Tax=Ktedonospora formicarum TaxID=2778364 RepID=A0A8J3MXH6_9CHLR|nr:histidine phosphatase family protein [Ktedonospora formicarum]GHO49991.1 phosphoglycerate mutase [Ktedonospora formicarum]